MAKVIFTREEEELLIDMVQANPLLYNVSHRDYKNPNLKATVWHKISKALKRKEKDCKLKWKYIRDYYKKRKRENKLPTESQVPARKDASIIHRLSFLNETSEEAETIGNLSGPTNDNDLFTDDNSDFTSEVLIKQEEDQNAFEGTSVTQIPTDEISVSDTVAETVTATRQRSGGSKPIATSKTSSTRKKLALRNRFISQFQKQSKERHILIKSLIQSESEKTKHPIDEFLKGISASIKGLPPLLQLEAKRDISNLVVGLEFKALEQQANRNIHGAYSECSSNMSPSSPASLPLSVPFVTTVYSPDSDA